MATVDTRPFDFGEMLSPSADVTHWNWNAESHFNVGESMGLAMARMLPTPATPPPPPPPPQNSAAPTSEKKCGLGAFASLMLSSLLLGLVGRFRRD